MRRMQRVLAAALIGALVAGAGTAGAAEARRDAGDATRTFGIRVVDGGDRVASIVGALGGVRVHALEPDSLSREIRHPDYRRSLNRGDFILRVRVKDIDPIPERGAPTLDTAAAFVAACDRVRSVVAALPERKATLVFDVYTQAGYNLEDWKDLSYEVVLDLSAPSS